jgi:hypothetical protein
MDNKTLLQRRKDTEKCENGTLLQGCHVREQRHCEGAMQTNNIIAKV